MEESPRPASPRSPDFINVTLYYYDFEASWGVALADLFGSCFLEGFQEEIDAFRSATKIRISEPGAGSRDRQNEAGLPHIGLGLDCCQ